MIWIIIVVVALVAGIIIGVKTEFFYDNFFGVIKCIGVAAVAIFLPNLLSMSDCFENKTIIETNVQEIVALQDTAQANGRYFLGAGTYQEEMYYFYYIETEKGYVFNKLSPERENVYIKYIQGEAPPRIEEACEYSIQVVREEPSFWWDILAWNRLKDYSVGDIYKKQPKLFSSPTYTIYVPEGSIVEEYNIDLQ